MKLKLIISLTLTFLLFNVSVLFAQINSAYVDEKGVLRWTQDNREVNEFGVNYTTPFSFAYWAHKQLNISHEKAIDEDVYHLTRLGLTAFRVHVWDTEVSDTLGNLLDNEHLRLLDYTLKKMKNRDFKIILTPIAFWNGIPEDGKKLPGFSYKYGKNNSYSNPEAINAAENYLYQFMNHINPYTGIAYKDDSDIIAFEISNEPEHPTENAEETTAYINRLVKAIRRSGCQKPLFYCMSIATRLLDAFLDADIQGGSTQWYPYSHNNGFDYRGNLLPQIDRWPKDSITQTVKERNKAMIAYEIDATDNGYAYTYPVMARELRKEGIQFAAMFTYDPLHLAYSNADYRTHFMNLAYTPKKALSLKIAGEAFHAIPMGKIYGTYPTDTLFDGFRVSHVENLAEMLTNEKFMYANSTTSKPLAVKKLKEIAGYGSSPIIKYNGRGAYFLDKLEKGIWRLEVMPDATWVDDPFVHPTLDKEVSAITWNTWPMTIILPDLGDNFSITGINPDNTLNETANKQQFDVFPGTYLLVRKEMKSKWEPDDSWKNITLNEFVAPPATTNTYLVYQPTPEVTKGSSHNINVEVISANKPESVQLYITTSAPRRLRPIEFTQDSRYTYTATIPDDLLKNEGILNYQIVVGSDNQFKIYPEGVSVNPANRRFHSLQMYTMRIVDNSTPVCLLDVASDLKKMRKPHRRFDFILRPSLVPGKLGLVMDADNMSYTSFFFKDKVSGRQADMATNKKLILRGYILNELSVKLLVSLQLKDGSEWGSTITLSSDQLQYELPLNEFKKILLQGPGERGPVDITPYPSDKNDKADFNLQEAETIKLTVISSGSNEQKPQAVIEYITVN